MGSYKEEKGDLIALTKQGRFDIMAHGANCQKVMGAGFAAQVVTEFPDLYYRDQYDTRSPIDRWGGFSVVYNKGIQTYLVNLYTQLNPGKDLDYVALELSLKKLAKVYRDKEYHIGLPMIGAGIAGGDWEKIKEIIKRVLSDFNVTVVIYDK